MEGLSLTAAHFKMACELLSKRYGRPEKLRFIHIDKMLNMKESDDLRTLLDSLLIHIRSLEALGVCGHEYGVFLTPLVLSKLPESVRLEWARGAEGKEGDLAHLLEFLDQGVKRRERSGTFTRSQATSANQHSRSPSENLPPWRRNKGLQSSGRPAATAAALTSVDTGGCGFCPQQHASDSCPVWNNLSCSDRYQAVKVRGLYFCCLESCPQCSILQSEVSAL